MKRSLLALTILLTACADAPLENPPPPVSATQEKAQDARGQAEADPDAVAAFEDPQKLSIDAHHLAGLAPPPQTETAASSAHAEIWNEHAEAMDEIWQQLDDRFLSGIDSFRTEHLERSERPLVYPFGGPDFFHAAAFFPDAQTYVLGGLEPPGRLTDPETLDAENLRGELERLRGGFGNLLQRGYFVSTQMERDFTVGNLDGFLPVLTIFLTRAGFLPTAIHYISLGDDGRPIVLEQATPGTGGAVRISATAQDGSERTIYYFSRDVSDAGLAQTPQFVTFLENSAPFDVYIKAGEYLLQMEDFSVFRESLLAGAEHILQDDSGFAWSDLKDRETRLFGSYVETLPNYRAWQQDDLRDAFAATDPPELPFAIGYHALTEQGGCLISALR